MPQQKLAVESHTAAEGYIVRARAAQQGPMLYHDGQAPELTLVVGIIIHTRIVHKNYMLTTPTMAWRCKTIVAWYIVSCMRTV